jgi:hypothetical protein
MVALLALAGCGGGGDDGSGASVALSQTPAIPSEPCPSPIAADCVVDLVGARYRYDTQMVGGRQSDYALSVRKVGLTLVPSHSSASAPAVAVDFRFSGGTTVEDGGVLAVSGGSSLHSDVVVQLACRLNLSGAMTGNATNYGDMDLRGAVTGNVTNYGGMSLSGRMTGNATNHGNMAVWATLVGNVVNDGVLTPGSSIYEDVPTTLTRIEGAFSQSPAGTLDAVIGATSGGVSVAGRADIDGTLRLSAYNDDWGPYPLPTAPFSVHVLHADGGVFGQFATLTSPGLLITGNLRYLDNDVFFDVTSISVAK